MGAGGLMDVLGTTGAETMRVLNKVSTLWPNARVEMRCGAPMWCPDGHRHVGGHGGSTGDDCIRRPDLTLLVFGYSARLWCWYS